MEDIRTPCCDADLIISMGFEGSGYMQYEVVDEIACSDPRCFNSWEPSGRAITWDK